MMVLYKTVNQLVTPRQKFTVATNVLSAFCPFTIENQNVFQEKLRLFGCILGGSGGGILWGSALVELPLDKLQKSSDDGRE